MYLFDDKARFLYPLPTGVSYLSHLLFLNFLSSFPIRFFHDPWTFLTLRKVRYGHVILGCEVLEGKAKRRLDAVEQELVIAKG